MVPENCDNPQFGLRIFSQTQLPSEDQNEQNRKFLLLIKEGEILCRLKNYKGALGLHQQAKQICGQMIDLVDKLLIFDYLGLGEVGNALRVLSQYEIRKSSKPSIFFLQVYSKLGLREQFFKVYNALEAKGQFKKYPGRMIIANLCLMLLYEQWGEFKQMNELFDKICNYVSQVKKIYASESAKIFRIKYCLLKYSFKLNKFQYRPRLIESIDINLQYLKQTEESNYHTCWEELRDCRDWDFRLAYLSW